MTFRILSNVIIAVIMMAAISPVLMNIGHHLTTDEAEMHDIKYALGATMSEVMRIIFEFFNHSYLASGAYDATAVGNAAEAFSISAMTPSEQGGMYVAFDFGSSGTSSYNLGCNSLGQGTWENNATLSFGAFDVTPCSHHYNFTYGYTDFIETVMAGIGHGDASGVWTDFEWFNHTWYGGGLSDGHGEAAETFSISAMAPRTAGASMSRLTSVAATPGF